MSLFHGVHPKKISVPALIFTLFFSALAGSLLVDSAAANPSLLARAFSPHSPPPAPSVTVTWQDTNSSSTFSILVQCYWVNPYGTSFTPTLSPVKVYVDGALLNEYSCVINTPVSASLENLQDGVHSMVVIVDASGYYWDGKALTLGVSHGFSGVIRFVFDGNPPTITNLSAESGVMEGDVQLGFRVIENSLSWVGYSLDGEGNVTVKEDDLAQSAFDQLTAWSGNLTLTEQCSGAHTLTVYARDGNGHTGASDILYFTIGGEHRLSSMNVVAIALTVIASDAAVSFGLVAYFLRRKSKKRRAA
jgi:hypothetical protein